MTPEQLDTFIAQVDEIASTFTFESQNRFSHLSHAEGEGWIEIRVHLTGRAPEGGSANHNLIAFGLQLYELYEPLGFICGDAHIIHSGQESCMYRLDLEKGQMDG